MYLARELEREPNSLSKVNEHVKSEFLCLYVNTARSESPLKGKHAWINSAQKVGGLFSLLEETRLHCMRALGAKSKSTNPNRCDNTALMRSDSRHN